MGSDAPTPLQPGFHLCLNCGHPTKGRHEFQGVIVCSNCLALAKMCENRAKQQVDHLYQMYIESIRVSLVTGRLKPSNAPWKPDDSRKPPTMDDLKRLLHGLADLGKEDTCQTPSGETPSLMSPTTPKTSPSES